MLFLFLSLQHCVLKIYIALNGSLRSYKSWTFVRTLQNNPYEISLYYIYCCDRILAVAKGYVIVEGERLRWARLVRWGSRWGWVGSGGWPRVPSVPPDPPLTWHSVSDHRTHRRRFALSGVSNEERLTIQIHKQEGTRTVAAGKIIKGHQVSVVLIAEPGLSISVSYRSCVWRLL